MVVIVDEQVQMVLTFIVSSCVYIIDCGLVFATESPVLI